MDSQQGELAWLFALGRVGMHPSPPLIGMYRSLPFCDRPDCISLLGLAAVSPLWCVACGGFLATSIFEFAGELNQDLVNKIAHALPRVVRLAQQEEVRT